MMDVATRTCNPFVIENGLSWKRDFLENGLTVTEGNPMKIRKRRASRKLSRKSSVSSENGYLDFKPVIKRCSVILKRISDEDLRKYLPVSIRPNFINGDTQPDMKSLTTKSSEITKYPEAGKKQPNMNIGSKSLATETHLDLLMAKEMKSSIQRRQLLEQRSFKRPSPKKQPQINGKMNPVVVLKRLSPEFISRAVAGIPQEEQIRPEVKVKRRRTVIKQNAYLNERRKSKRSSVLKMSCSCCSEISLATGLRRLKKLNTYNYRHNSVSVLGNKNQTCLCNRWKGSSPRSEDKDEDIYVKKEGSTPKPKIKKPLQEKQSSDDEDFYGFEFPEKNQYKTHKTLKTLRAVTAGKENKKFNMMKPEMNFQPRQKIPFKAVNRIDPVNRVPENISIFKEQWAQNDPSRNFEINSKGRSFENDMYTKEYENCTRSIDKMEILKLFEHREETRLLLNRLTQDQSKFIKSRKGSEKQTFLDSMIDIYSEDNYISRCGKIFPIWAEESITRAIMFSQERIPREYLEDYFYRLQPPLSLARLFSSENYSP